MQSDTIFTGELDAGLEQAHLAYLRGDLHGAHAVLADLNHRYPGNADVERLLAEVVLREPPPKPPLRPIDWSRAFTADVPYWTARSLIVSVGITAVGAVRLVTTLYAGLARGFGSSMVIGMRATVQTAPVWTQMALGAGMLAVGGLFLLAGLQAVRRALSATG